MVKTVKSKNKKSWATPQVRQLEMTDELLELFARDAKQRSDMAIKRTKLG